MTTQSGFVNVFDTGHVNDSNHSQSLYREYVESEKLKGGAFNRKYKFYNKDHGRTHVLAHERPRFIKDRLNYRMHDLPHAHNPVTDHFVPSFTGFPLPARGLDRDDMSGHPRASSGGACFPGGSAVNPRRPRDIEHGKYHSINNNEFERGATSQAASHRGVSGTPGDQDYIPPLYPTRYTKGMATMLWRSFVERSGKNNVNQNKISTYGRTYRDPRSMNERRRCFTVRCLSSTM